MAGLSDPVSPEVVIAVQAESLAPQVKTITLSQRANTLDFILSKAAIFRGRIIDQNGMPLEGATIRTDAGTGEVRKYDWLDHSTVDGHFEWNSAPTEEIPFCVMKEGYQTRSNWRLTPDSRDHEITLQSVETPDE